MVRLATGYVTADNKFFEDATQAQRHEAREGLKEVLYAEVERQDQKTVHGFRGFFSPEHVIEVITAKYDFVKREGVK